MPRTKRKMAVGDVVVLKSGGPRMTIESIDGDRAHCVWTDDGCVVRASFAIATLRDSEQN